MNNYYSNFFDDSPVLLAPEYLTEKEREVAEKIDKAKDSQEIANIISEALVRSLMEQLEDDEPAKENVSTDIAGRPQKKNRRRHSREGYMTEQQWQDFFNSRDNSESILSDNPVLGTEEDFKQIHTGRTIKEV